MAQYPIPNPQFGIYNNNNFSPQPTGQSGLTIDDGKKYFLTWPNAQTTQPEYLNDIGVGGAAAFEGAVTFNDTVTYNADIEFNQNVIVDGTATVGGNLLCDTTATVSGTLTAETGIDISVSGGITFPDNTTQTTAYDDTNTVQNNQNNTFLSPYIQTFQGSNSTTNTTGPLQFSNVSSGEYGSFYVDPSPNNDLTLYSNQSNGGLTIRNVNGNSFTVNPQLNNANFFNPIVTTGSISSTSVNITNSSYFNSGNNTGINNNVSGSLNPFIYFAINDLSNVQTIPLYIYYNSLLLASTLNMNSNNITNCNSITDTTGNYVTTNTPTSGDNSQNIATTAFVNTAIGAIGGGVSLSGDNVWTNFNNFNVNAGALNTKTYVYGLTPAWNITPSPTGGAGDCSLIANTGTGSINNAFQIYCVGTNTVSSTIATSTPQLTLSNNGYPMQVKDGINIPTGETYAVNGVNILNNTNLLGSPTLANNPPSYSNNTSIATTQFVQSLLPRFTSSTYILNSTSNCTMTPTSGTLITQSVQSSTTASNIITFYNSSFLITINTSITNGTLATLAFDIPPWQDYPTSGNALNFSFFGTNFSTQAGYFFNISFKYSSSPPFLCTITYGNTPTPPVSAGNAYSFNFSDLGNKSFPGQ